MGSLTKYSLSYVNLHYNFPGAPYYFVLLLVQSIGYGKLHPVQPLTDSELSTCWIQWKDFTHQPQINTSSLFCILWKAVNWEVRNNEELLLAPTSGYPKHAGSYSMETSISKVWSRVEQVPGNEEIPKGTTAPNPNGSRRKQIRNG